MWNKKEYLLDSRFDIQNFYILQCPEIYSNIFCFPILSKCVKNKVKQEVGVSRGNFLPSKFFKSETSKKWIPQQFFNLPNLKKNSREICVQKIVLKYIFNKIQSQNCIILPNLHNSAKIELFRQNCAIGKFT